MSSGSEAEPPPEPDTVIWVVPAGASAGTSTLSSTVALPLASVWTALTTKPPPRRTAVQPSGTATDNATRVFAAAETRCRS